MGTLRYMAPECMNDSNYGPAVDVWAFGVLLILMFTLRTPLLDDELGPTRLNNQLQGGQSHECIKMPEAGEGVPTAVNRVIHKCLRVMGESRPTFDVVLRMLAEPQSPKRRFDALAVSHSMV